MQCSCGNSMVERSEIKNGEVVTRYYKCWHRRPDGEDGGCGRIKITWQKEEADASDKS